MNDFIYWIFSPDNIYQNIFTLITVVMSGVVSWIISAIYFHIGNRNSLVVSVLLPMKRILGKSYTRDNYKALEELSKNYSAKYLYRRERSIIRNLLSIYREAYTYSYARVCAGSLLEYFKEKLEQNGIKVKIEELHIDDETTILDYPLELLYMLDELTDIVEKYHPEMQRQICYCNVICIFNRYCEDLYSKKKITFFDDRSFEDVLNNSEVCAYWEEKHNSLRKAIEAFEKIKAIKEN